MTAIGYSVPDNTPCKCDDCGKVTPIVDLESVSDIGERLDAGGIVPAGECECGALAYISEEHAPEWMAAGQLARLERHEQAEKDASARVAKDRFRVALDIQDAGNMQAIAREFVRVVDAAIEEVKTTTLVWEDAAVRLFVNKLESLARSEANYGAAYVECHKRALTGQDK